VPEEVSFRIKPQIALSLVVSRVSGRCQLRWLQTLAMVSTLSSLGA
jgi:hypothetical protein